MSEMHRYHRANDAPLSMIHGERNTPHRWTRDQKHLLCTLRAYYEITWVSVAQTMNSAFCLPVFRAGSVSAMWSEFQRPRSATRATREAEMIWASVEISVRTHAVEYLGFLQALEKRARDNGIQLTRKRVPNMSLQSPTTPSQAIKMHKRIAKAKLNKRSMRAARSHDRKVSQVLDESDADQVSYHSQASDLRPRHGYDPSSSQSTPAFGRPLRKAGLVPITDASISSATLATVPPMLFRTYNRLSGGHNSPTLVKAGHYAAPMLLNVPVGVAPVSLLEQEHWSECHNHLTRRKTGTKLISTTTSLVWAIHRLLRQTVEDQDASLLLIDGLKAARHTAVFETTPVIEQLEKVDMWPAKHKKYRGTKERLVWGEVVRDSIHQHVTLKDLQQWTRDDVSMRELLRIDQIAQVRSVLQLRQSWFSETRMLDTEMALSIGRLASRFGLSPSDPDLLKAFICTILQNWVVRTTSTYEDDIDERTELFQAFRSTFKMSMQVTSAKSKSYKKMVEVAWFSGIMDAQVQLEAEIRR